MEVYKGEYVELEQDNIELNFDNEQEEKNKIIPNNENEGSLAKNTIYKVFNIFHNNPKSNLGKSSKLTHLILSRIWRLDYSRPFDHA
ncbi:hypothetical protein C1645_838319 [Glomus cerebriforme]|uniref:Uncharacterized protein n=1 Tax=Glomus cerebriforme TaxID=658196 RepID=A0A397S585_9GLOM|nr:hypothetical protein C1645_838319 [Glomus cerebriforme]